MQEMMSQNKQQTPEGYDLRKCIVVGRTRRQPRDNGEMIPHSPENEIDVDI
jgi:hypothetical protein